MFSWPLNGKTYLIRGRLYWRYDEAAARPDPGYPRDLSLWEGAPPAPEMSPSATRVGELAHPGGRAMRGQGLWGGGTCRGRGWGRSGAERGVWRVGRRGPAPQTSPSPQVTPSSSRASTTGASTKAASKPSQTPPTQGAQVPGLPRPQCGPSCPQTPQSDP